MKRNLLLILCLTHVISLGSPARAAEYDDAFTETSWSRDRLKGDDVQFSGSAGLDGRLSVGVGLSESLPAGVGLLRTGAAEAQFYGAVEKAFRVSAGRYLLSQTFQVESVSVAADGAGLAANVRGGFAKVWLWVQIDFVCDGCQRGQLHAVEFYHLACTNKCGLMIGDERFTMYQNLSIFEDEPGTLYVRPILVADVGVNGQASAAAAAIVDVVSIEMAPAS